MMIYLAPLQGITDRIYRNLFPVYFKGVDAAIAPFISSSKKMKPDNKLLREFYPENNTGIPTIPQIMSSAPADFIMIANKLYDVGCGTVNWNLGCPYPMVVRKGRGAGLLCDPVRVESFLETAMPLLKPNLSIKLRIGLKYPDEVLELMPIFNRFPIEELVIHPRTGAQMYGGNVDLDIFGQCLDMSKHRVVYNGDIDSFEKFELLTKRFGSIERWMLGRGLLANPFLAEKIKFNTEKPYAERIKIIRGFHDHLFAEYLKILSGPSHITNKMKAVWTYLGDFFEDGAKIKKRIWKTHHRDNYLDVINKIFSETPVSKA
ncbi:MAG: tRNA dihydrouridine synthase DusB [Deltaproteobacteria bacterium HGW-Deltaproteobacteria-6]|jgi:tRNA-dihydrouridine synthase|nr:MAG: tRNA dihydrouridine synthase DusB [Deltaproteobacteria bacterium HGW-Deltaproteobacteria-6]